MGARAALCTACEWRVVEWRGAAWRGVAWRLACSPASRRMRDYRLNEGVEEHSPSDTLESLRSQESASVKFANLAVEPLDAQGQERRLLQYFFVCFLFQKH